MAEVGGNPSLAETTRLGGGPLPPAPGLPVPGQTFGDYEVLEEIGRGGMGAVFKARNRKLHRLVALKVLLPGQRVAEGGSDRFLQEARILAQLDHHNLVTVYHVGECQGLDFIEMQYIEGKSAEELAGRPLEPAEACRIIEQVARALSLAHQRDVIHRDIKPSNILLTAEGLVKVVDFGLAKQVKLESGVTSPGMVLGSPAYMAPEQWLGRPADARTDLYALGATFYFLVTGQMPFSGDVAEVMQHHLHAAPRPPHLLRPAIPETISQMIVRLLQKDPDRRHQSAAELIADLRSFEHSRSAEPPLPAPRLKAEERAPARVAPLRAARSGPLSRVVAAGAAASLLVAALDFLGALDLLELRSLDLRFALARGAAGSGAVSAVMSDQESKDALSPHGPLSPERHYGKLLGRLADDGARAIGVDLLIVEQGPEDASFGAQTGLVPAAVHSINLLPGQGSRAPSSAEEVPERWSLTVPPDGLPVVEVLELPVPAIVENARRVGHVALQVDPDSVIRRIHHLLVHRGRVYPSLSLATVMTALGVERDGVKWTGEAIELHARDGRSLRIPVDAEARMLVNYRVHERPPTEVPLARAIGDPGSAGRIPDGAFKDQVVFFGSKLAGDYDVGSLPNRQVSPLVLAHALAADTMLSGSFVVPLGRGWTPIIIVALGAAVSLAVARFRVLAALGIAVLLGGLYLALCLWEFDGPTRRVLPVASPLAGAAAACLGATAFGFRHAEVEKRKVSEVLARYLSPAVTGRVLADPEGLKLGGKRKELTILSVELASFSEASERLEPEEVDDLLGRFFERMTAVVFRHEGTLNQFTGRGLRAFFGDPVPQEDHAARALRCALELRAAAHQVIAGWAGRDRPRLQVGIGVHTGYVTVGNVGSLQRMEYTILGRNVDLADQLAREPGKVVTTSRTVSLAGDEFVVQKLPGVEVGQPAFEVFPRESVPT